MHMHSISRDWKLGNGKNVAWESGARAQAAEAAAEGDVSGDVWVMLLGLLLNVFCVIVFTLMNANFKIVRSQRKVR